MKRRDVLRSFAALPLLTGALAAPTAEASSGRGIAKPRAQRRVRPPDREWPQSAAWDQLNQAVGGSLIKVQPVFAACAAEPKGALCLDAIKNARNPFYLGDQPAGTQVSGWLDAWSPAASVYAVAARQASDVAAAVDFARENNLRIVVKGGGHSYQGTSNAPDSLLIWTRHMHDVSIQPEFVPQGCQSTHAP